MRKLFLFLILSVMFLALPFVCSAQSKVLEVEFLHAEDDPSGDKHYVAGDRAGGKSWSWAPGESDPFAVDSEKIESVGNGHVMFSTIAIEGTGVISVIVGSEALGAKDLANGNIYENTAVSNNNGQPLLMTVEIRGVGGDDPDPDPDPEPQQPQQLKIRGQVQAIMSSPKEKLFDIDPATGEVNWTDVWITTAIGTLLSKTDINGGVVKKSGDKTILELGGDELELPWQKRIPGSGPLIAFLRIEAVGGTGTYTGGLAIRNPLESSTFEDLVDRIIDFVFVIAVAVAPLIILIAAFIFFTAAGRPEKLRQAGKIILWTVIGFAIVLLAKGLLSVVKQILGA